MSDIPALSITSFYGEKWLKSSKEQDILRRQNKCIVPYLPRNLLYGPNIFWKVFYKQDQALEFMKYSKGGLMCYAFEHDGSGRLFLVAHPEVFWHYDVQRDTDSRNTYEIIAEFTACKIYVDIEYDVAINKSSNGSSMVRIFIEILLFYLQDLWGVVCSKKDILNLDSSTTSKFSRHLIFNLPSHCFSNNYQVGYFIRYVCQSVKNINENGVVPEKMVKQFTINEIKSLMVVDAKGNLKLFCDEGVYTKNRHFRLYGSTKKGKHSNLCLSADSEFKAPSELNFFLSSLITYIETHDLKVIEFPEEVEKKKKSELRIWKKEAPSSPHPEIDKFISHLIYPGKIYRSVYFGTKKVIVYDVVGNRYCGNIGREHKRNNIMYVVDLVNCVYYQKCHDYDCSNYRSEKILLPNKILFYAVDNTDMNQSDMDLGVFGLSPSDTDQLLDALEACSSNVDFKQENTTESFPLCGLRDEDFINIHL